MTVETTISRAGPYAGAGTVGPFPVPFRFLENGHLRLLKTNVATGAVSTLVLDTDYTVVGAGNDTGAVTLANILAAGYTLTVLRNVPATQEADYVENDPFPAESHEMALDKLTMLVQQQGEVQSRALVVPATDPVASRELPSAAARARRYLSFNDLGEPVATTFDIDAISQASQAAIDAAARAADSEADAETAAAIAVERAEFVKNTVDGVTPTVARFSGTGAQTVYTLPSFPGAEENTDVFISGVYQQKDTYSVDGDKLTFNAAPPVGTNNIEVNIAPNVALAIGDATGIRIDDNGTIRSLDSYVKETRADVDALDLRADELEKNTVRVQGYTQLRAYSGSAAIVDITSNGLSGRFMVSAGDVTSADDGGTLIVGADGRRWLRTGIERIQASWFGVATGVADVSDPMEKCLLAGRRLGKGIDLPGDGFLTHTKPIVFRSGDDVIGQGEGRTAFQKTTNLKSGLPPLLAPEAAGAEGITDVYDVDACMIVVPDAAGQYARNITLKGFYSESRQTSRSTYGFYAPRICLSNFKDLAFSSQTAIFMKNTWMVAWERVRGGRASVGWAVVGDHLTSEGLAGFPAGGTSNSFRACWAHDCAEAGWSFDGLTYSFMDACGVDNVHTTSAYQARGYSFQNCRGIVLGACGAEGITGTWLYVDKSIVSLNGCTAYWMNLDAAKVAAITNPFAVLDVVNGSSVTLDNCSLQYDGTATKVMPYFISDASRVQLLGGTKLPITGLLFGVGGLGDSASALYDATRETIRAKVRFQVAGGAVTIVRATPGVTVVRNGVGDFTVSVPTSETVFNDLVPVAMSDQFAITTTAFGPGVHRFTTRNSAGVEADPANVSWVCF